LPAGAVAAATIAISVVFWNRPTRLEPVHDRSSVRSTPAADRSFTVSKLDSEDLIGRSPNEGLSPVLPYFHLEWAQPVELIPGEL
jgi:hypothetical protein